MKKSKYKLNKIKLVLSYQNKIFPRDLIAVYSDFSERLPMIMIEDSRTAKGRPIGTNVQEAYKSNSKIKFVSRPFQLNHQYISIKTD